MSQNKQKAEALELFLVVGENTKQQRNENERKVYVCSQTMACMCYESLEKYKDGYLLAKRLLQERLNETERNDVGRLLAINGYFYAYDLLSVMIGDMQIIVLEEKSCQKSYLMQTEN